MENQTPKTGKLFTSYEIFVIAILAILQFTIILDFMVLSPLGAFLLTELSISTKQFGWVVSGYAFSAGVSGILTAGFADKYDRKKLLLFFYVGFLGGTMLCAVAKTYEFLLMARIVTGIFGGVIGSIGFAIITDLFRMEVRGRVMGFVQMAFASSQVLGLPIGLYLANRYGWNSPFFMIVGVGVFIGIAIIVYLKPIDEHLKVKSERNALVHLGKTISNPLYLKAFAATILLATGGFMLMPFGSTFSINNLKLTFDQLPLLYMITGVCSMIAGPLIGKYADTIGKYTVFVAGSVLGMIIVGIYGNLGVTELWIVIILNVFLFIGISSRMITAGALMSAIPDLKDRGAFMSINSSIQQISGGVAAAVAGLIVVQSPTGQLQRYDLLCYVVVLTMAITVFMMYFLNRYVTSKPAPGPPAAKPTVSVVEDSVS
ncbi:MAG: MFS transporter [Chryseolinea sp.]